MWVTVTVTPGCDGQDGENIPWFLIVAWASILCFTTGQFTDSDKYSRYVSMRVMIAVVTDSTAVSFGA